MNYNILRNAPLPQHMNDRLDLWLGPTDLIIDRDLLLKTRQQGLSTYKVCGAKRSWVIRRTRCGRLAWPLTLTFDLLTWTSLGVIYSSRTIYLPRLKLVGQSVLELSVAQGEVDWHDLWPWPTDLNINWDHLLIKDYLRTNFEASGAKRSWVISCTRLRDTDIPTDRRAMQYASPSLKGDITIKCSMVITQSLLQNHLSINISILIKSERCATYI